MINQDIVFLDCNYKNSDEMLTSISDILQSKGYVKNSFKEGILSREKEFPTAIKTENFGISIPHTDSEHIIKPGIAFVRFNDTCRFNEMCTGEDVDCNMSFVLLVKEKEKQVGLLTKLMGIFSNNEVLDSLYRETNPQEIERLLNKEISN